MKKIYLIVDVTDKEERYRGDCRGMTESPDEAKAMLQRIKQSSPGRKIVKKTLQVVEVEVWPGGDPCDLCSLIPTICQEAEI